MILKYTEKRVNLGNREYTVIIPHGIEGFMNSEYTMDADRNGLNAILISLYILIENKNRIIYFPLWHNKVANKEMYRKPLTENRYQNFDVVMLSEPLEHKITTWRWLPWIGLPQRCSVKNDWLHVMELGFYDKTYKKDNDKAPG